MTTTHLLVLTTLPSQHSAETLAAELVDRRLAACIAIQAPCQSVYRWENAIERTTEIPLLIKTTAATYPALEQAIRERHPYALPEIIALPITAGLPAYLTWVSEEASPNR